MRQNKGLSQETMADLIGITQSNYSRRENGKKKITENEWKKIAKALNVELEEIYQPSTIDTIQYKASLNNNQDSSTLSRYIKSLEIENANLKQKIEKLKR